MVNTAINVTIQKYAYFTTDDPKCMPKLLLTVAVYTVEVYDFWSELKGFLLVSVNVREYVTNCNNEEMSVRQFVSSLLKIDNVYNIDALCLSSNLSN